MCACLDPCGYEDLCVCMRMYVCVSPTHTHAQVPDPTSDEANEFLKCLFNPVLELTHNHGTEDDAAFSYHNGNTEPKGFGHVGFLVDDVYQVCGVYVVWRHVCFVSQKTHVCVMCILMCVCRHVQRMRAQALNL